MSPSRLIFAIAAALCIGSGPAWSCWGHGVNYWPLAERYQSADVVAMARCVAVDDDNPKSHSPRYEIVSIERDTYLDVAAGAVITLRRSMQPGSMVWLMGGRAEQGAVPGIVWDEPIEFTASLAEYVRRAPPSWASNRLEYFAKYFEDPDDAIAFDAWSELSWAPREDFIHLAKTLRPVALRRWLANTTIAPVRRNQYGLMLAYCGGPEDATCLERCILEAQSKAGVRLDGLMSGYVLLRGGKGLDMLESEVRRNKRLTFEFCYGMRVAISHLRTRAPGTISEDRLRQSTLLLLDRPEISDLVIADFARSKDWTVLDRIASLYSQPDFDIPSNRRTVIRYLYTCITQADADRAAQARQHLASIRDRDPKTVRNVERSIGLTTGSSPGN